MDQPDRRFSLPCPDCDGFASAHVTHGGRDSHGHLHTVSSDCPACQGTGALHPDAHREGARV